MEAELMGRIVVLVVGLVAFYFGYRAQKNYMKKKKSEKK